MHKHPSGRDGATATSTWDTFFFFLWAQKEDTVDDRYKQQRSGHTLKNEFPEEESPPKTMNK
jgi:hypothetical protein